MAKPVPHLRDASFLRNLRPGPGPDPVQESGADTDVLCALKGGGPGAYKIRHSAPERLRQRAPLFDLSHAPSVWLPRWWLRGDLEGGCGLLQAASINSQPQEFARVGTVFPRFATSFFQ